MATGASDDHRAVKKVLIFDLAGSGWVQYLPIDDASYRLIPDLSERTLWPKLQDIVDFAVVVIGNELYIIGGFDRRFNQYLQRLIRYSPEDDTWADCSKMMVARSNFSAVVRHGKIYVTGGEHRVGKKATKTTALWEIYDPKTDRWTKGGILPAPRKNHACALAKSKIYLSGGLSEGEGQRNVWIYESMKWREIDEDYPHSLGIGRERHSSVIVNDVLYIIGGIVHQVDDPWDGPRTVTQMTVGSIEAFQPNVSAEDGGRYISPWDRHLPCMKYPRHDCGALILGHKIYVLGGTDPKGEEVTNVEYFNTVTKKWKPSLKMSSGHCGRVTCAVLSYTVSPDADHDTKVHSEFTSKDKFIEQWLSQRKTKKDTVTLPDVCSYSYSNGQLYEPYEASIRTSSLTLPRISVSTAGATSSGDTGDFEDLSKHTSLPSILHSLPNVSKICNSGLTDFNYRERKIRKDSKKRILRRRCISDPHLPQHWVMW